MEFTNNMEAWEKVDLGFSVWFFNKCTVSSEIREDNKSADTTVVREGFTQEAGLCRAGRSLTTPPPKGGGEWKKE